jgi:MFS family permease
VSSSGYGLMLGALGVGAVLGAFLLSRLRARFGQNTLLTAGAVGFAVATAVLALVHNVVVVLLALVVGGMAWLLTLSTLNASMQLSLPAWVRARGLSVYQLIFMGGQAMGSLVWGLVAAATTSATSTRVTRITTKVRKMIRSRCGKNGGRVRWFVYELHEPNGARLCPWLLPTMVRPEAAKTS